MTKSASLWPEAMNCRRYRYSRVCQWQRCQIQPRPRWPPRRNDGGCETQEILWLASMQIPHPRRSNCPPTLQSPPLQPLSSWPRSRRMQGLRTFRRPQARPARRRSSRSPRSGSRRVSAWSWFYRVACTSTEQGALVTSKQAAAEARQAQASTRNSSSFLWLPGKVLARSRQPSEEPQDEDMQQAICSLLNSLVQEGNKQSDLCIATTLPSLSLITGKLR